MEERYGLHSEFDIEKHKAAFTNYLEVVIDADGKVMYAVPSHQEKLIAMACQQLASTRDELKNMCPRKYYGDFMRWLCLLTGAMPVWNDYCEYGNPSVKQIAALRKLKMAGLYRGFIPSPSSYCIECNPENLVRDPKESKLDPQKLEEALRAALLPPLASEKREDP